MQAVYFGISSPAQYRLFGDGAKTELAKATLLRLASCGTALSAEEKAALESQE
jgi:dimethylaniline monooxygenase (N-oxide forming)